MSKPVFENIFTFSGRRNRKSFVFFHLAIIGIALLALLFGSVLTAVSPVLGSVFWIAAIIFFIGMAVAGIAVTAQRIRDFGHSGCWIFLYLIPFVGFAASVALFFIPSNPGENKYGPSCI